MSRGAERYPSLTHAWLSVWLAALGACGSEPASTPASIGVQAGATADIAGTAGLASMAAGGSTAATPPVPAAIGGSVAAGSGGMPGTGGAPTPAAISGGAGAAAPAAGSASGAPAEHDHCRDGELADARDAGLTGQPESWKSGSGAVDLVLPKPVLAWMGERAWEASHDAWHNVRRCRGGSFPGGMGGANSICSHTELIPQHQECADAEDGYQFLVMHRHMMRALRQSFPQHTQLFAGFPRFPFEAKDVPQEWQGRWGSGWSSKIIETATTLEDIENKLSQFPTEGDLGRFIQCGGMASGASSIHGALHFKWVVNDSPHSLGKQTVNIDNFMFWKLHGWIDTIWERYRTAKGLAASEPKLTDALAAQCREMHNLGHVVGGKTGSTAPTSPLPVERGVFHESVRPVLEKTCSGCHSESSPEAGLSLGGQISSAKIVQGLVNVLSMHGGQFKRVVPGDAAQSWLYLKVAGMAQAAGCVGSGCNTQVMPPTGQVTLSASELGAIQKWIADGAAAPTP